MYIFYLLIILVILLLLLSKNKELFSNFNNSDDIDEPDNIYEINTIFPDIIDRRKAPYDDPFFYCKDDEYRRQTM